MELNEDTKKAIRNHALQEHPRECCGVIVDGHYYPCNNVAEDPENDFKIHQNRWLELYKTGHIEAVIHSHPVQLTRSREAREVDPRTPSEQDMKSQLDSGVPWGIVATEGESVMMPIWLGDSEIAPLEGRPFVHGIHDCYSIVRDYYKVHFDITLPDYPREYKWWEGPGNLYLDNFQDAGFEAIPFEQRQPGDVLLIYLLASVPNHAAIFLGGNEILHHYTGRPSKRDRLNKWQNRITHTLRYTANK